MIPPHTYGGNVWPGVWPLAPSLAYLPPHIYGGNVWPDVWSLGRSAPRRNVLATRSQITVKYRKPRDPAELAARDAPLREFFGV